MPWLVQDTIFESYSVQSAAEQINLEVPLEPLLSALRAASPSNNAANAGSNTQQASMRLTKKQGRPVLCVSLVNKSYGPAPSAGLSVSQSRENSTASGSYNPRERETRISLDVPVRLLPPERVAGLHEPRCRDPEVHIMLPNLQQLKAVSDRFTKLAGVAPAGSHRALAARLTLSATMHGTLRLGLRTDTASVASVWRNLNNPDLDPAQAGAEHVAQHPSTRMRAVPERPYVDENDEDEDDNEDDTFHVNGFTGQRARGWATVRVDARDWSKVLSVGRLACTRVIACTFGTLIRLSGFATD